MSLSKALFKNSFAFIDSGNQKKSKKYLTLGLLLFIIITLLPSLVGLYFLTQNLLEQLLPINQEGVVLALTFQGAGLIIFFFAIFLIPAIFYFSKDIENLLSVPLRPVEIIASKFTVTYIYETALMIFLVLPILIAYVSVVDMSFISILMLILVVLTLPILPLVLASIVVMCIMWLVPFFKNRDLFNMLSGIIALAFALWINFAIGGLEQVTSVQLIDFVIEGNNSLTSIFKFIFVSYPFGLEAIFSSNLMEMGLYAIITASILGGFLFLSNIIYFRGVLGINETASRRKVLSNKQLMNSSQSKPAVFRYFLKEIALLFRTPVYFLNNVSIVFLLPVLLLASTLSVPSQRDAILEFMESISFDDPLITGIVLISGIAIGLVLGSINLISATAISREGSNVYFMKMIPMSIMNQLHAKVLSGIFYSSLGLIFLYGIVFYFIRLPWYLFIASFGLALISIVFVNYYSILVDVLHPKLVWESEQAAVKQNMNFLFTMLPAGGIAALMFYLVFKISFSMVILSLIIAGVLVLLTLVVVGILKKIAYKTILNY